MALFFFRWDIQPGVHVRALVSLNMTHTRTVRRTHRVCQRLFSSLKGFVSCGRGRFFFVLFFYRVLKHSCWNTHVDTHTHPHRQTVCRSAGWGNTLTTVSQPSQMTKVFVSENKPDSEEQLSVLQSRCFPNAFIPSLMECVSNELVSWLVDKLPGSEMQWNVTLELGTSF